MRDDSDDVVDLGNITTAILLDEKDLAKSLWTHLDNLSDREKKKHSKVMGNFRVTIEKITSKKKATRNV